MWAYPFLTIVTILGVVAVLVLVQLGVNSDTRSQLFLGLGSWAVALVLYAVTRRLGGSISTEELEAEREEEPAGKR